MVSMDDQGAQTARRSRGGAAQRRAQRTSSTVTHLPVLAQNLTALECLSLEGLELIEHNADTVLQEIGIEFHDEIALAQWKEAGADVQGQRVRFERGFCRELCKTLPQQFVQHARNPERSVMIGGRNTVFAPNYGSPFYLDYQTERRYATLEDFQNIVKLVYRLPALHHSGGTVCEPVDVPVNKRHLDMVWSHLVYSDKPIMGSVTAPERAQDTVDMLKLVFGADFVDQNCCSTSLINANSPMIFDETMLGALRVYAQNNQACIISPFIIGGAMSPVTPVGVMTQALAEVMTGLAYTQVVRQGAPAIFGTFASSMSMQSGAPTFGTPEPGMVIMGMAALARRMSVPFRTGGSLNASKIPDAQAAYETMHSLYQSVFAGTNFILHSAGWLEGGLVVCPEKLIMDADQLHMLQILSKGPALDENGQAMDAIREVGPGKHYLGCEHTKRNFETAYYPSTFAHSNSFEQWDSEGRQDSWQRAHQVYQKHLANYEAPSMDIGMRESLDAFVKSKKDSMPDLMY